MGETSGLKSARGGSDFDCANTGVTPSRRTSKARCMGVLPRRQEYRRSGILSRALPPSLRLADPEIMPGNLVDLCAVLAHVDVDRRGIECRRDGQFSVARVIFRGVVGLAVQRDGARFVLCGGVFVGERELNVERAALSKRIIGAVERRLELIEVLERALSH